MFVDYVHFEKPIEMTLKEKKGMNIKQEQTNFSKEFSCIFLDTFKLVSLSSEEEEEEEVMMVLFLEARRIRLSAPRRSIQSLHE